MHLAAILQSLLLLTLANGTPLSYRPVVELAALVSPRLRVSIAGRGIELVSYADLRRA